MMQTSNELLLQTTNLGKRFKRRWAVRDLNLTVRRGEVFGFLGPNGAGKSTTIRMLLSLVKPTTGAVSLFGKSLRGNRREVLARIGGLVERPDFYLYLSGRKNLEIVSALKGDGRKEEIDEVLDIVGLLRRADDGVKTYSHGMKQRLGIAQALLGFPEVVILDEPTSGLDPQGIKEVRDLIRRLRTERSMTIFLSSHLLHEIEKTATSMAIINAGTVVVQGGVQELLSEGDFVLRVEARPVERALRVLSVEPGVEQLRREGEVIECSVPRKDVGALNRRLVEAGIEVNALVPKRSLEDYFLSITEGQSGMPPVGPSRHPGGRGMEEPLEGQPGG
ncbi:MAG: ABC transporter ATP-binding protein [Bacteroidota bacterium]